MLFFAGQRGGFQNLSWGPETLGMTSEALRETFECDFVDKCAKRFPLLLMRGRATPSRGHTTDRTKDHHKHEHKFKLVRAECVRCPWLLA